MDEKSLRTVEFDRVLEKIAQYTGFSAGRCYISIVNRDDGYTVTLCIESVTSTNGADGMYALLYE